MALKKLPKGQRYQCTSARCGGYMFDNWTGARHSCFINMMSGFYCGRCKLRIASWRNAQHSCFENMIRVVEVLEFAEPLNPESKAYKAGIHFISTYKVVKVIAEPREIMEYWV